MNIEDSGIIYRPSENCKPSKSEEIGAVYKCPTCKQAWIYSTHPRYPGSLPKWKRLESKAAKRYLKHARKRGHAYNVSDLVEEPYGDY